MPTERRCEKCGAVLATFGDSTLCPNCMLHEAVGLGAAPAAQPPAAGESPGVVAPVTEASGQRIGRYKLLQPIGEGGMGVVYMAEQQEPVHRRVALKVIKLGMDTKSVIARFEAERQALALMDHPNIAKVLDAGATETGRPYFVMELVRGIRITDYCDQNHLTTQQRLDLFTQICKAIQHAHQKGIIHRDIKPSNILVTLHDGVPVPKIIDFGVAKATSGQRLTEKTLFTAFQQFIGTPAYMSPEQAEMGGLDIDTRSDIYSLGVLLYELLTGKTPFDTDELLQAGLDEMRRKIREDEPRKPSTRLSTLAGAEAEEITNRFKMPLTKLAALIRGDLDWIVMKALEKDRVHRYETANGLAADIQRHLKNEPIVACPPTSLYRFRKMVRRNKLALGALATLVAALVMGLSLSDWAFQEYKARHYEEQKREQLEAEHQALRSEENLYAADVRLAQTALEDGNLGRARSLLEGHWPKPGQTDLRGFEWRYLWNLCQGDQLHTLRGHSNAVTCVAFSPDGKLLASGSEDHTVKLWDVASKQLLVSLPAHDGPVNCFAFTPDGRTLVTGGADGFVRFWNLATKSVVHTINCGTIKSGNRPVCIAFSPTEPLVAIATADATDGEFGAGFELWKNAAGKEVNFTKFSNHHLGHRVAFSPDGKTLASATDFVELWDIDTGSTYVPRGPLKKMRDRYAVLSLNFSPDGRTIAASTKEGVVPLWDVSSGQKIKELEGHKAQVNSLAFSTDGDSLATASADQTIRLWSFATGKELAQFRGHGNEVLSVAFSPDGEMIATGSKDSTIMIWHAKPKAEPANSTEDLSWPMSWPIIFSPNGKLLVDANHSNRVDSVIQADLIHHGDGAIAFLSDNKTLVTVKLFREGKECSLRYWDVKSRTIEREIFLVGYYPPWKWQKPTLLLPTLSPDGSILASTGYLNSKVTLWNTSTGKVIGEVDRHTGERFDERVDFSGAFSPNSKTFATAGNEATARIWDVATQKELAILAGHKRAISWAAFSPDGKTLATSSRDDTVKLWDVSTWKEIVTLSGHKHGAYTVAFCPDGRTLAVGTGDGKVKLWNLATYREVATLKQRKTSSAAFEFSPFSNALAGAENPVRRMVFSPDGTSLVTKVDGALHWWSAPFVTDSASDTAYAR